MPGRYGAQFERLAHAAGNASRDALTERQTMRIVELVGRRMIVGCGCGNYFFAMPGLAVCDHCGAEGDTDALPIEGDAMRS